jgi:hypothetical protein
MRYLANVKFSCLLLVAVEQQGFDYNAADVHPTRRLDVLLIPLEQGAKVTL